MMQEFVDQINKSARSATEDMHTALPGEIKSYDPDKGVATVLPKAKFTKPDGSTMDFPEISGVPVMFPQSKNVTIAWPIKKGDGCLLVFSEQALDYWMYGKETDTKLKFDLTNAIAIPNLTSGGNSTMKLACDEDAVAIAAGDTTVKITPSTVQAKVGETVLTVSLMALPLKANSRSRAALLPGMMLKHPTAASALQTTPTRATAAA